MSLDIKKGFIPYWLIKTTGLYDVMPYGNNEVDCIEYFEAVEIYERNGHLRFINPDTKKEMTVKGLHGWMFRLKNKEDR